MVLLEVCVHVYIWMMGGGGLRQVDPQLPEICSLPSVITNYNAIWWVAGLWFAPCLIWCLPHIHLTCFAAWQVTPFIFPTLRFSRWRDEPDLCVCVPSNDVQSNYSGWHRN